MIQSLARGAGGSGAVLILDDNPEWAETTERTLRFRGLENVRIALDIESAEALLRSDQISILLVDVDLGSRFVKGRNWASGDAWLMNRVDTSTFQLVCVITAYPGRMLYRERLEASGVRVIVKASREEQEFLESLCATYGGPTPSPVAAVERAIQSEPLRGQSLTGDLSEMLQALLLEWLAGMGEREEADIFYAGRLWSVDSILEEVASSGPFKDDFLKMFIVHLRSKLRNRGRTGTERSDE